VIEDREGERRFWIDEARLEIVSEGFPESGEMRNHGGLPRRCPVRAVGAPS
jgi:hypothetical protein